MFGWCGLGEGVHGLNKHLHGVLHKAFAYGVHCGRTFEMRLVKHELKLNLPETCDGRSVGQWPHGTMEKLQIVLTSKKGMQQETSTNTNESIHFSIKLTFS